MTQNMMPNEVGYAKLPLLERMALVEDDFSVSIFTAVFNVVETHELNTELLRYRIHIHGKRPIPVGRQDCLGIPFYHQLLHIRMQKTCINNIINSALQSGFKSRQKPAHLLAYVRQVPTRFSCLLSLKSRSLGQISRFRNVVIDLLNHNGLLCRRSSDR